MIKDLSTANVPDDYASNYDEFRKDWISTSMLSTYIMCGLRFKYTYIDKLSGFKGMRATMGSAVHKAREVDLTNKMDTEQDMNVEELQDVARDYVCETFESSEVETGKEFEGETKESARGIAVDMSVTMAQKDREDFLPIILPVAVEETMAISFPNLSRIVVGKLDVRESHDGDIIRDLKTGKRAFGQAKTDSGMGLTTYGMLFLATHGKLPDGYKIDNVINSGKRPCKTELYATERSQAQIERQLGRFVSVCDGIDKGVFMPANPVDWWCSKDWCSHHHICPFAERE